MDSVIISLIDPESGNYFIVNNNENKTEASLVAYDASNDKKLWKFTFDAATVYPQIEDIVVAGNSETMLVRVFHLRIGNPPKDLPDTLFAVNKKSGKLIWQMDLPTLRPMIAILGDTFYLSDNSISAYKLGNAALKWKYTGNKYDKYIFPLQLDKKMNTIITGYGSSGAMGESAEIVAIHADNGTLSWRLPERKFINLAYEGHIYNGLTYSNDNTIKWMSLSPKANEIPVLQSQWELGSLPSGRGYIAHLLRTNELTLAQVEDNYSSYDSQLAVFNNKGDKLGMLEFKSNVSVASKPWKDWIVFASDAGQFGLLQAKSDPSLPHKPDACPSIAAIQSVGFNQTFLDPMGWWAINTKNNYGLKEDWSFRLWIGEASNGNDALTKAKKIVTSLKLVEGPYQKDDVWGCEYNGGEFFGLAFTPPQN